MNSTPLKKLVAVILCIIITAGIVACDAEDDIEPTTEPSTVSTTFLPLPVPTPTPDIIDLGNDDTPPLAPYNPYTGFIRVNNGILTDEVGLEYKIYGINTTDNWYASFATAEHAPATYADISNYAMNTVRVCLNAEKFEQKDANGNITFKAGAIESLKKSINNAASCGIRCIIDMHNPPGGFQAYMKEGPLLADEKLQRRYLNLWRYLAEAFKDNEYVLGYGLMNEPVGPYLGSQENAVANYQELLQKAVDVIREVDKNHILIIQNMNGTYDETSVTPKSSTDVDWTSFLDVDFPTIADPQNNVMLEFHYYKSAQTGYGSTLLAKSINADNVESRQYTWWDDWASKGVMTANVMSFSEADEAINGTGAIAEMSAAGSLSSVEASTWKTISADFSYLTGEDVGLYNPKLDILFGDTGLTVYVNNIRLVKTHLDGTEEEIFYSDISDGIYSLAGTAEVTSMIADSPFDAGKKVLQLTGRGQKEVNYTLFRDLIVNNGEVVTIYADVAAVSATPVDISTVARFKTDIHFYTEGTEIFDEDSPLGAVGAIGWMRDRYLQRQSEAAAKAKARAAEQAAARAAADAAATAQAEADAAAAMEEARLAAEAQAQAEADAAAAAAEAARIAAEEAQAQAEAEAAAKAAAEALAAAELAAQQKAAAEAGAAAQALAEEEAAAAAEAARLEAEAQAQAEADAAAEAAEVARLAAEAAEQAEAEAAAGGEAPSERIPLVTPRDDFSFLTASVQTGTSITVRYVWHDYWHGYGLRGDEVVVPAAAEASDGVEWQTVAANIKIKSNGDMALLNPMLDIVWQSTEDVVYVDNLRVTKTMANGEETELFFTDFNDTAEYMALGAKDILSKLEDNPFAPGDKLLKFPHPLVNKVESTYILFSKLILEKDETLNISMDTIVVADQDTRNRAYARIKTECYVYSAISETLGMVYKEDKSSIEKTMKKFMAHSAKYNSPPYIGELGSSYPSIDIDPNYEEWYRDVVDVIDDYNIGFTWHSLIGGGFGLYEDLPVDSSTLHPVLDEMFRKYFMDLRNR